MGGWERPSVLQLLPVSDMVYTTTIYHNCYAAVGVMSTVCVYTIQVYTGTIPGT